MLKPSKSIIVILIRVLLYSVLVFGIMWLIRAEQFRLQQHYDTETAYVTQQRIYLVALANLDSSLPEFNANRAHLMQRIYDLQQKNTSAAKSFNTVIAEIYQLDSILDKLYFYQPGVDLQSVDQAARALRARSAIDGLAAIESRLVEAIGKDRVSNFSAQQVKVTDLLSQLLESAGNEQSTIQDLAREYTILIDVAWSLELSPFTSDSGRQTLQEVTDWLYLR